MLLKHFGFVLLLALVACTASNAPDAQRSAAVAGPVYLDVRTAQEYQVAHVRGALNIPHDQIDQRAAELEQYRNRRLVVYCRTGHRAGIALEILKSKGFARAENGGALQALEDTGVPIAHGGN